MKKALITGVTGQDGSYLSEFLLEKGYEVHGIVRRASTFNTQRIDHLFNNAKIKDKSFFLHYGDLSDGSSINDLVSSIKPDEVYNLGAQSHVKVSFEIPEYTMDANAMGTQRLLNAILKHCPEARYYQASTSEMYGGIESDIPEKGYDETSRFHPRSPYAVAKVCAYWTTVNYREAYDLHASNGILFNHETLSCDMPVFIKEGNEDTFDIKPLKDVLSMIDYSTNRYQQHDISTKAFYVWGKKGWVKCLTASAYPHDIINDNKNPKIINSRNYVYHATGDHICFFEGDIEKKTKDIKIGDKTEKIDFPENDTVDTITVEEAELIGMLVADGYFDKKGRHAKFTKNSKELRDRMSFLWGKVTNKHTSEKTGKSGFPPYNDTKYLNLKGGSEYLSELDIYTSDRHKRIPKKILNSSKDIKRAFLTGYNKCNGLKSNPCTYEFKNFKTNSPTLAQGLYYLVRSVIKQEMDITVEQREGKNYYSINILAPKRYNDEQILSWYKVGVAIREIARRLGIQSRTYIGKVISGTQDKNHYMRRGSQDVKKIIDMKDYSGWYCDLETESGEFFSGIGNGHVHNSPRRGGTFVTKKITDWFIKNYYHLLEGKVIDPLRLGNIYASRDWGHAKDYVEAMWLMLQQDTPDDYVIATGETHTVKEFVEECFKSKNFKIKWKGSELDTYAIIEGYIRAVEIDPIYFRPSEVEFLKGNPSKAKEKLGWEPKYTFSKLVRDMIKSDFVSK